jgi:pyruvate formate lyase activating enzyme
MEISDIIGYVIKDKLFYDKSGGGITLSGGEPLIQPDGSYELLRICKKKDINTAIETCGYTQEDILLRFRDVVDYLLFDIKTLDNETHKKYCGVENTQILSNLKAAVKEFKQLIIRFPLIGGVNDDDVNISRTFSLVKDLGLNSIDIMPYHELGVSKYTSIGYEYQCNAYTPSTERLSEIEAKANTMGLSINFNG